MVAAGTRTGYRRHKKNSNKPFAADASRIQDSVLPSFPGQPLGQPVRGSVGIGCQIHCREKTDRRLQHVGIHQLIVFVYSKVAFKSVVVWWIFPELIQESMLRGLKTSGITETPQRNHSLARASGLYCSPTERYKQFATILPTGAAANRIQRAR